MTDVSTDFAVDSVLDGDNPLPDASEAVLLDNGDGDLDKCLLCRMFS
jgi:hypothetical protein